MHTLRALVVYESMFGNTETVAAAVADGLALEGAEVSLLEVSQATPADVANHDLLVVGAPTHAFSLSRRSTRLEAVKQGAAEGRTAIGLREWLAGIKGSADETPQLAACFDTRVTKVRHIPKSASSRAGHLLVHNGFTLVERPVAFLVHDTRGPLEADQLERARAWGSRLATRAQDRLAIRPSVRG
jgi:flavodoxin